VSVKNLRFFATAPAANATHGFNGHTVQANYDAANHKQTAYGVAATTSTRTPEVVPTVAPGSANIGIGGSLTGSLTAAGTSDFVVSQIQLSPSAVAGTTMTLTFRHDEIA
jgi:hypothetical protein